jgi:hypothetical protein
VAGRRRLRPVGEHARCHARDGQDPPRRPPARAPRRPSAGPCSSGRHPRVCVPPGGASEDDEVGDVRLPGGLGGGTLDKVRRD